ncbi:uncharacterized protein BKCO1_7000203 [Diplodia corticola]|uniref:Uncharacterized protein n=1 Tax=Diplodia corticola TaxID=236234 RepID=A0A1J9RAM3_9PEZI|nr:uncharacterized protein BKCO1_7000203 [Diplodia corticola]OJD37521.1 hypothetical protein BKCO1_7000203 [Diplodia corticola]
MAPFESPEQYSPTHFGYKRFYEDVRILYRSLTETHTLKMEDLENFIDLIEYDKRLYRLALVECPVLRLPQSHGWPHPNPYKAWLMRKFFDRRPLPKPVIPPPPYSSVTEAERLRARQRVLREYMGIRSHERRPFETGEKTNILRYATYLVGLPDHGHGADQAFYYGDSGKACIKYVDRNGVSLRDPDFRLYKRR